jgi:hypothetical protein
VKSLRSRFVIVLMLAILFGAAVSYALSKLGY